MMPYHIVLCCGNDHSANDNAQHTFEILVNARRPSFPMSIAAIRPPIACATE